MGRWNWWSLEDDESDVRVGRGGRAREEFGFWLEGRARFVGAKDEDREGARAWVGVAEGGEGGDKGVEGGVFWEAVVHGGEGIGGLEVEVDEGVVVGGAVGEDLGECGPGDDDVAVGAVGGAPGVAGDEAAFLEADCLEGVGAERGLVALA